MAFLPESSLELALLDQLRGLGWGVASDEIGGDGVSPSCDDAFLENDGGTPSPPGA